MSFDPDDLEFLIDHHQEQAEQSGHPPLDVAAWRKACRQRMLGNEHASTGHITRAAAGLRAKAIGQRLTGWREVRGTHGIDYEADKAGTDRPPWM